MRKLEHIGIAVKNLEAAEGLFERLLGSGPYKREEVPSEQVTTSFFRVGTSKIELLESSDQEGPIARFIDRRGEGIHHLAFEVQDIASEIKRLKQQGFQILNETPRKGADNKWVVFIHPKSAGGVLVELCQEIA